MRTVIKITVFYQKSYFECKFFTFGHQKPGSGFTKELWFGSGFTEYGSTKQFFQQ